MSVKPLTVPGHPVTPRRVVARQNRLPADRPAAIVLDSNALWGHIVARTPRLPTVSLVPVVQARTRLAQLCERDFDIRDARCARAERPLT